MRWETALFTVIAMVSSKDIKANTHLGKSIAGMGFEMSV